MNGTSLNALLLATLGVLACAGCSVKVKQTSGGAAGASVLGPNPSAGDAATPSDATMPSAPFDAATSATASSAKDASPTDLLDAIAAVDAAPDPSLWCDFATKAGDPIIVPCLTRLEFGIEPGVPAPGGSQCNPHTSYLITMATNVFEWAKCLPGPTPDAPYTLDSGSVQLSDAELASLLDQLKIVTVAAPSSQCDQSQPVRKVSLTSRKGGKTYWDSARSCNGQNPDQALDIDRFNDGAALLDARSHK